MTANTQANTYTIKLPQFEGPFDLLLFFIERDELDIHDIPIAKITDDFLAFIRCMEEMNIDLASEFILVAATLCRIKVKMLLPRKQFDEEGNEIDPREELVQRLLEYKRYKSVLDDLRKMEARRGKQQYRGNVSKELQRLANKALVDAELESLTLYRLLKAFERVVERFEYANSQSVQEIIQFNYTIEEQQEHIFSLLKTVDRPGFEQIFGACRNRIHAIITFLAMLELINQQKVNIVEGLGANNFWLEAA
jgi:segregation and condensation protein A